MPTLKQKKVINRIIENHGNISKSMKEVGYTDATCKNPKNLTESKGFKELCEECGLTNELILKSLTEDIKLKPQNRKGELELGAKITGMLKDDKQEVEIKINLMDYGDNNSLQLPSKTSSTGITKSTSKIQDSGLE